MFYVSCRYPRGHRLPEDTTEPSPWYSPSREEKLNFTLPPDGIVTLTLQAKNDEFETLTVRVSLCYSQLLASLII